MAFSAVTRAWVSGTACKNTALAVAFGCLGDLWGGAAANQVNVET